VDPQPKPRGCHRHLARPPKSGASGRPDREDQPTRGSEEGPGQLEARCRHRHGSHRHRPEGAPKPCGRPQDLGSLLPDLHIHQLQPPHDVAQEVGPPPVGLHERHRPLRPGQLQDQPRYAGAAPDVEQRRRRLGEHREKQERVQDQVLDLLRRGPIPRETAHPVPPAELLDVDTGARLESGIDRDPECRHTGRQAAPRVRGHRQAQALGGCRRRVEGCTTSAIST